MPEFFLFIRFQNTGMVAFLQFKVTDSGFRGCCCHWYCYEFMKCYLFVCFDHIAVINSFLLLTRSHPWPRESLSSLIRFSFVKALLSMTKFFLAPQIIQCLYCTFYAPHITLHCTFPHEYFGFLGGGMRNLKTTVFPDNYFQ